MVMYLVVSLITGFTFAAVSFLGFGTGFWTMMLWYVAGCWAGFGLSLATYLMTNTRSEPPVPHWPEQASFR